MSVKQNIRMQAQKQSGDTMNGALGSSASGRSSTNTAKEVSEIRRMLTGAERTESEDGMSRKSKSTASRTVMDSILDSMQKQGESIRAERQQNKDTSVAKKKFVYHFKSISSQIISSKTAVAARQVALQATREILKLKKDKMSGKYDNEEVEAAILHAQSMERVARKKVRHLEEEELVKAAGVFDEGIEKMAKDDPSVKGERFFEYEYEEEQTDTVSVYDRASVNMVAASATISDGGIDELKRSMFAEDLLQPDLAEMTDDMMDAFSEGMRDLMEEMGFSDPVDSLLSKGDDVDPEDLKMAKIKHRIREMKEIAEADSEYLKAVFERLERMKSELSSIGNFGGTSESSSTVSVQADASVHVSHAEGTIVSADTAPAVDIAV